MQKQCKLCPWRKDADPNKIPGGYCQIKHANLKDTIATPGELNLSSPLRLMACHESKPGKERACVGWLANQYGAGNNIALRMAVISGRISMDIELVGEQHETLEDTLPEKKNAKRRESRNPSHRSRVRRGGDTVWIQGIAGTVLRIKLMKGHILSERCTASPSSHADLLAEGNLGMCLGSDVDFEADPHKPLEPQIEEWVSRKG